MQAGAFFGALLAYPFADKCVIQSHIPVLSQYGVSSDGSTDFGSRLGRRPSLLIAAVFALVGGVMQAAASGNLPCLYVGRVIEGLGLGAATMLTPVYISE